MDFGSKDEKKKATSNKTNKGKDFVVNFDVNKNIERVAYIETIESIKLKNKYSNESRAGYRNRLEKEKLNEKEIESRIKERTKNILKNAFKDLELLINKDILNKDSGLILNSSKGNLEHLLYRGNSEIKATICSELEKVVETAIFLKKHLPKKERDETYLKDIYLFGNIVNVNNKLYAVKITAKHFIANNRIGKYNLNVNEIIKGVEGSGCPAGLSQSQTGLIPNAPSTKINIKYLLENVKDEKEKYFSEYLLNN